MTLGRFRCIGLFLLKNGSAKQRIFFSNSTVLYLSIDIYELTSNTTRTLIGQKSQKPMFYCTGKPPLPDSAALRSTTRKDE